ncbi:RDD family protein [Inconstantimicrobium mannanitabidum]|uniref:Uncharacterized protein n=1 Tax=Inconstantimicrobium mannanitabidum TaxID=1604901 RepID=A0ACB5R807_9CLOT|nr:RDD family protein [Clostridium sp. TW13]GKX65149.1 hypothetical protein rsdtw13_04070 [Clostridium sp. TW13]
MNEENKNVEADAELIKEEIAEVKEEIKENEIKEALEGAEPVAEEKEDVKPAIVHDHEPKKQRVVEHVKAGFFARLVASIVDQVVVLALSVAILYAAEGILLALGFFVTQIPQLFFIIYIIVAVLYLAVVESTKLTRSIGKALLKI